MNFFIDESISQRAALMLDIFDEHNTIDYLWKHFERGTTDRLWLAGLRTWEPKPIVVSGDGRILRKPDEKHLLKLCDLHFVYLGKGWMTAQWNEFAWKIIKSWPDICHHVGRTRLPTVWEVNFGGKVSAMYPLANLRV